MQAWDGVEYGMSCENVLRVADLDTMFKCCLSHLPSQQSTERHVHVLYSVDMDVQLQVAGTREQEGGSSAVST